jgi:hypothetical protein
VNAVLRIATVILIGVLCSYVCHGAELIEVTASVDKQTAYIGDLIEYKIEITYDTMLQLTPPPAGANLGGFEVKDYDFGAEEQLDNGRARQVISFELRTFTTGDYVIPGLPVEYMTPDSTLKYISADPIKINIKSLLAEGIAADSLEPRPNKGQASLVASSRTLWLILGGVLVVAAVVVVFYFVRRRKTEEELPYVDPRPAWEIAYADLAVLKDKDLPAQDEVKQFYFELSEIIKRYLGRKFEFDAVDMTTAEIGNALADLSLDEELCPDNDAFMKHADLVKFAKYIPPSDRPDVDWETAYTLISRSKDMVATRALEVKPEPVMAVSGPRDPDEDDSDLRFAPPELRPMLSPDEEEDRP